jgi:hypothetical protein
VNETAAILPVTNATRADQDANTNKAIRVVASTPSAEHIIPANIVAGLYRHVDQKRAEFFAGQLPEVVLSFDVTDKRTLGHYVIRRNGLGVRWNINLNPVHFARPLYHVLSTLLHELAHAWQYEYGTPSKPPHHNKESGRSARRSASHSDEGGHDLGVRHGSLFEEYCRRHGVAFPLPPGRSCDGDGTAEPRPLLPEPPVKPKCSKLKKWTCPCGVNVRVAIAAFDATCNKCGGRFAPA